MSSFSKSQPSLEVKSGFSPDELTHEGLDVQKGEQERVVE